MINAPIRYSSKKLEGDELVLARLDAYRQLQHTKNNRLLTMGERKREAELHVILKKKGLVD